MERCRSRLIKTPDRISERPLRGGLSFSGLLLQKMGIMPRTPREFRHSGPKNYQIRDAETLCLGQETRQQGALWRL